MKEYTIQHVDDYAELAEKLKSMNYVLLNEDIYSYKVVYKWLTPFGLLIIQDHDTGIDITHCDHLSF